MNGHVGAGAMGPGARAFSISLIPFRLMPFDLDWDLLARYAAGECAAEEAAEVDAWIAADPSRRDLMQEIGRVWAASGRRPRPWDVEGAWQRVHRQMAPVGRGAPVRAADRPAHAPEPSRNTALGAFARIGGALVLTLGALFGLFRLFTPPAAPLAEPEVHVFTTQRGQRATLQLGDGTRVNLNVDSRLTVPVAFAVDRREVVLEGEAFFEVAPDAERPFRIRARHGVVQVLGTAFNLRAYDDDATVQVVVTEGKVSLRPPDRPAEEGALLTARQLGRLAEDGHVEVVSNVNVDPYRSWTTGRLVFDKTPLAEVAEQLERWYDVQIRLASPRLEKPLLTATLENASLNMALNIISITLDLRYERDGRYITFHPAPADRVRRSD